MAQGVDKIKDLKSYKTSGIFAELAQEIVFSCLLKPSNPTTTVRFSKN